jgi:hypothetical protein
MLKRFIAMVAVLLTVGGLAVATAAPASANFNATCFGYTGTFADPGRYYPTEVYAT